MVDLFDEIRQVYEYTVWNKYIDLVYLADKIHPIKDRCGTRDMFLTSGRLDWLY